MTDPVSSTHAHRSRLLSNISALFIMQGLSYVIPLITLPYLVRTLGIARFGTVALAQAVAQYFVVMVDGGFNLSATRKIAMHRGDATRVTQIFSAVYLIKLSLFAAGASLLACACVTIPRLRDDWRVFTLAYATVAGNVLLPGWLFQGFERMRVVALVAGGGKLAGALALFWLVHKPTDYLLAVAAQSASSVLAGAAGLLLALYTLKVRFRIPTAQEILAELRGGWHLFVSSASILLYTNTNVVLIGFLSSDAQAGLFSAAERIVRAATQGLIKPIGQALFPRVSALASDSRDKAAAFIRSSMRWVGGAAAALSLTLFFGASPLLAMAYGSHASDAVAVLRCIAPLPVLVALSNMLGIQTMVAFGLHQQFSRVYFVAGVVNLSVAVPLVLRSGASGAAVSVAITEAMVTATMAWLVVRSGLLQRRAHTSASACPPPFARDPP